MKAKFNGMYSSDLPAGFGELPTDPANCWVIVQFDIGSDEEPGADCFTAYVTTPKFLSQCLTQEKCQMGRGIIIVKEFTWELVELAVKEVCLDVVGDTWQELVAKLSRFFIYEYE